MVVGNVAAALVVAVAAVRGPQAAVDRAHVRATKDRAISSAPRRRRVNCNSAHRVRAAIRQRSRANATATAVSVARDRIRVAHSNLQRRVKRQRDNLPDREDSQDRKDAVATDAIGVGNIVQRISIRSAWLCNNRHRAVDW